MDADIEQAVRRVEEAIQHLGRGEPGREPLCLALLPQLLRPVAHIPGLRGPARASRSLSSAEPRCGWGPAVFQQRFHGLPSAILLARLTSAQLLASRAAFC